MTTAGKIEMVAGMVCNSQNSPDTWQRMCQRVAECGSPLLYTIQRIRHYENVARDILRALGEI